MTLDEAIKHCEDVAEDRCGCAEDCVNEHRQLAEWLKELRERRAEDEPNSSEKPSNCDECPHAKCLYEADRKDKPPKWETPPKFEHKGIQTACVTVPACLLEFEDEPQTYITEDRDTQILDAWQVHRRNTTSVEDEPQTETEIAKEIVHKMIDNSVIAEDAYPDLRQRMHEAVERLDEYYPSEDERSE